MAKVKNKEGKSSSQSFFKGAMILTLSMVLVKICGLLQKVLLTNLYSTLGDTYGEFGTGLFANAYELYVPLYTLATIGFPIAIARMVSENYSKKHYNDVKQTYSVAKPFFIIMGTVCFLLMAVGSFAYVSFIDSPYSQLSMLVLSPTIFFGCLVSIYRGYFEGLRNMTPTATSEVIEAVSKIAIGVVLAYVVLNIGSAQYDATQSFFGLTFNNKEEAYRTLISFSVAASIVGITMGSVLSYLYMKIRFVRTKGEIAPELYALSPEAVSKSKTFSAMVKIAVPVGIGALVMSFASSIDASILNRILSDMAENSPNELLLQYPALEFEIFEAGTAHTCIWGYYSSALTILSIVVAVTQAFGTSAMPNVTNAFTKGDKGELTASVEAVMKLTAVFSIPCGIGLSVLAKPILSLIFFTNPNIAEFGAASLQVMGGAAIFMGLLTPICSMLQAVGKSNLTMFIYIFGTSLKVVVSFVFAQNISINIVGSAIGSLVAYLLMCAIAFTALLKYTKVKLNYASIFLKPLVGAIACGASAYLWSYVVNLNVIVSVLISIIVYFIFLLILHTFNKEEVKLLPKGEKIVIILEKLHLIR